jgi:hypothetical protein
MGPNVGMYDELWRRERELKQTAARSEDCHKRMMPAASPRRDPACSLRRTAPEWQPNVCRSSAVAAIVGR